MKIIVSYASAGAGHFKAAQAIFNYLRERCPDAELKLVDVLDESSSFFAFLYRWGYSFLVRRAVFMWAIAFFLTDFKPLRSFSRKIAIFINRINTADFAKFLIQENPDIIISTHFLPSEIAAYLKRNKKINSELITQVTDFGLHPFWISEGTDIYIVSSGRGREELIRSGVRTDIIKEFGIPIDSKFRKDFDKNELYKKFNLDSGNFTVLIMTGSFGTGPIEGIVDKLCNDVQVLIVCANNKKLYSRLLKKNLPNVRVFGFVDNAQELMAVSDIIITKPGGLSIAESLAMDLFPVFISPIPGQETENIKALALEGVGVYPKDINKIKDIVIDFKKHPEKLISAREIIRKIKKPDALRGIFDVVCANSAWDSC
mgnify:FL=1